MKNRIGKSLMAVAILQLMTSFIFFGEPIRQILAEGNVAAINTANIKLTALFFSFGIIMLIAGVIVDSNQTEHR